MTQVTQNTEIETTQVFSLSHVQAQAASLVMLKADALESAKSTGIQLVAKYLDLKESEVLKCFYTGKTTIEVPDEKTGNLEKLEVAQLVGFDANKKAQIYFCGSKVIMSAVATLAPNTPIEVAYLGEESLGKGKKLKQYSVELLEL